MIKSKTKSRADARLFCLPMGAVVFSFLFLLLFVSLIALE
jgi:hypothetical protein